VLFGRGIGFSVYNNVWVFCHQKVDQVSVGMIKLYILYLGKALYLSNETNVLIKKSLDFGSMIFNFNQLKAN